MYSKKNNILKSVKIQMKKFSAFSSQSGSQTSEHAADHGIRELRKIEAHHKFPCFGCFDKPIERMKCSVCNSLGFVRGDHPMVQFADDYFSQHLTKFMNLSEQDEGSLNGDDDKNFLGKKYLTTQRKQSKSAFDTYSKESITPNQNKLAKSSNLYKDTQFQHFGYMCDGCEKDPIEGVRYNCQICQDYDLCEACYRKGNHNHRMKAINGPSVNEANEIIEEIRSSMQYRR